MTINRSKHPLFKKVKKNYTRKGKRKEKYSNGRIEKGK
jgi:hypothetical protein